MKTNLALMLLALAGLEMPSSGTGGRTCAGRWLRDKRRRRRRFCTPSRFSTSSARCRVTRISVHRYRSSLTAYLSKEEHLLTLERADLMKLLSEHELGLSGVVQAVDSDRRRTDLRRQGADHRPRLRERGRISPRDQDHWHGDEPRLRRGHEDRRQQVSGRPDRVDGRQGRGDHSREGQATARQAGDTEALVERLAKQVEGKELPTVSVSIAETHASRRVIDPAAETEVVHLLRELGFTVVDPAIASEPAQIKIVGEALSEFATRRGNLISCQGRVELKAVESLEREHPDGGSPDRDGRGSRGARWLRRRRSSARLPRLVERLIAKIVSE